MEKCRDVTQGYTTQQECDKWPQQICQLEKKVVKKYSPETEVKLFAYYFILTMLLKNIVLHDLKSYIYSLSFT